MELGGALGHFVHSTLVHPGDTWDEMWTSLDRYLPEVNSRVSPHKPFGVSIRITRNPADHTWDVLPEHLRTGNIVDYVVKDLDWVKGQLHPAEA